MKLRNILLPVLAALAFTAPACAQDSQNEQATAQIERIAANLPKYIAEIDRALEMAKEGGYGKLERGSEARLTAARETMGRLLQEVSDPRQLSVEKRMELYNAHAEIASILSHQDKDRVVCTRERKTGSRVGVTECLTVAEREERAKISAETARNVQRTRY